MTNKITIRFEISQEGELFSAQNTDMLAMKCSFNDGLLDFFIIYDFKPAEPQHLKANAGCGDKVEIVILPYRMELYVNAVLLDEEWPCGNNYLKEAQMIDNGCGLSIQNTDTYEEPLQPAVLGTFQNAEGWKPEQNVSVGDCMPYSHEDAYHVLYLRDRHSHLSKWWLGAHQWGHISTKDFKNWEIHPMAIAIDDPMEGSICTGSWFFDGEKQYLFYAVRMSDYSPARICRSVSEDGYHFKKDKSFGFTLSDEKYLSVRTRDPKIIKDNDGLYHMLITTTIRETGEGCLAHLVSKDLNEWTDLETPFLTAPTEPECSDYFFKDGYYYLVYSLGSEAYYQYSKEPFGNWKKAEKPIPCEMVPKAAIWKDRLIFTGFKLQGVKGKDYAGTMTFVEAVVQEDGHFEYKKLS